jgi:hypothetical protein
MGPQNLRPHFYARAAVDLMNAGRTRGVFSAWAARPTIRRAALAGLALTSPAATLGLRVGRGQGAAVFAGHGVALVGHSGSGSETLGR